MDSGNKTLSRKNPRATASALSALTFAWTLDIFKRGYRKNLDITDLCEPLPEHTAELLGNKFEKLWNKEVEDYKQNPKRRPSLIRVILKAYGSKIVLYMSLVYVSEIIFKLGQPLLLSKMLQHFAPNSTVTTDEAKLYAGGVVLCMLGNLVAVQPFILANMHLGMKVRVAVCSLIYRKSLRLTKEATSKVGAGRLVNILSNDASRFDLVLVFLPDFLMGPVITALIAYVIWVEAGPLALTGAAVPILFLPFQAYLAKKTSNFRSRIAVKTDHRIRLMSEIVAGIQVIKMYAWEKSFAKLVALARKKEVDIIRKKTYTKESLHVTSELSTKLALYASLIAYASYGNMIRADVVFAMVLCYHIVEDNLTHYFPLAISYASECYVSIRRMEAYLLSDEATEAIIQRPSTSANSGAIDAKDLCAKWSSENAENTLDQLNLRIRPGSLVAVIGAVGSGKSSLLQLILREVPVVSGTIDIGGTVSYASQEPWLFGGTICQNILFGLPMDTEKYNRVVKVCALRADFKQLPSGDKTAIGDRGVRLSGGQRARINLARAVYRDADIYLLDDPLSAVDSHVSKHLFEQCIRGYLSGKTVVLVTHHVQRLTNVGHVIQLDGGKVVAQGSFQELCASGLNLHSMEESALPEKEQEKFLRQRSLLDVPSSEDVPEEEEEEEVVSSGKVRASVYFAYLNSVKNIPLVVCAVLSFIVVLLTISGSEYWLAFWVNEEEYGFTKDVSIPLLGNLDRNFCMTVYGILIGCMIVSAMIRTVLYCVTCMKASTNLHDTMFRTISQATMNFFNNTSSGQILNRFSRDAGIIDETLPDTLQDCFKCFLLNVGSLVIIFIVNYYLMIPFIIVMVVLYFLRQYYVATSRNVKRIESITRSPIYTHVNASLQGLSTIRAMRAQSRLHQEFDQKMDAHSSAWYYILSTNRAFAYYLDVTCFIYISIVTFSFLIFKNDFLGGDVGLAITQSMSITFLFQWCIRQSAEVENQMTSVERVCEFGKVNSEDKHLDSTPESKLSAWPSNGSVQFSDVSLFYETTGPAVLKNVNFDIRPGEKIGVVGRTGAGKSSLVAALFRLQRIEGNIIIDGIETGTIGLRDLRSKLSIIPQDPVIFSGTMRFNLDPFEEYKDSDLWNVLEEVELKSVVKESPLGLHINLAEGGVNLSVGQRQLVCLARAILRNSKVLVLDEATANVDAQTDNFIQAAIRRRFAHCTVITIAHRLNTIMDSDRILVMDKGRVVEFGPPQILLLDPKGHFTHLVGLAGMLPNVTITQSEKGGEL